MERQWFLESVAADGSHMTYNITHLPFCIGRDADNDLVVASRDLSRHHVALTRDISGRIRLTDLNSTNGSFVNRQRIEGSCLLDENDIVHFGTTEFRVRVNLGGHLRIDDMRTMLMPQGLELSARFVRNEAEFLALLEGHGVSGAAQPIVDATTNRIVAYELLGRANHPLLPISPIRLFELASALDREIDLSRFPQVRYCGDCPTFAGFPAVCQYASEGNLQRRVFRLAGEPARAAAGTRSGDRDP